MSKKRVFITHGYQSSPDRNWFFWLKETLEKKGIEVFIPALSNPEAPVREVWLECLDKAVGNIDEHTFFVAHSLGCITDLYFLSQHVGKAGGMILVAGFAEKITAIPELVTYSSSVIDFEHIIQTVPHRIVFGSPQDYIVPFEMTKRMAKRLDAKLIEMPDCGHFMEEDGFETFPALLLELENLLDN